MNVAPKDVRITFLTVPPTNGEENGDESGSNKKKRKTSEGGAATVEGEVATTSSGHNGVVSDTKALSNPVLLAATKLLKQCLLEFVEHLTSVKIWIQLNIPRIEDGNNFGVGIQEETLAELERAEEAAFGTLESVPKYFILRAKYITKTIKYPGVADFQNAVHELDQKEYLSLCMTLKELRNNYSILHDMISKNWDKIVKPRSESTMVY